MDNSGISDVQRSALSPDDPEYTMRYVQYSLHFMEVVRANLSNNMADLIQIDWGKNTSRRLDHSSLFVVDTQAVYDVLLSSAHCTFIASENVGQANVVCRVAFNGTANASMLQWGR